MIREEPIACGPAALADAKAFMRIDGTAEDAVLTQMIESACGVCEAFIGRMLVARGVTETVAASGAWTRLGRTPVISVASVSETIGVSETVGVSESVGGVAVALVGADIDIDADGDGWVRHGGTFVAAGLRMSVTYRAGMAVDWVGVPVALRGGIVRLAAHLYAHRDARGDAGGSPPAAVAALWRPFRRVPFGRAPDRPGDRPDGRVRRLGA